MTWNRKWDERCRVTEETQAYYRKMDKDEREFREFRADNWDDVELELDSKEKFERVLDAMTERVFELTGGDNLHAVDHGDRYMLYSALYLACAVKFRMDEDTLRDARGSFEDDLDHSSAMNDLIEDEIIKRWDQQA